MSDKSFLTFLLQDSNHHVDYNNRSYGFLNKLGSIVSFFNVNEPISIIENSFGYESKNDTKLVYNDDYNPKQLENITDYIKDPNPTKVTNPIVYIYNTHQLENYSSESLETYGVTPNVMMASYLLKEDLNEIGIPTIVEESNITEFLDMNNWDYSQSYKASRFYILDTINKYNTTKLFIDLHRDSIKKSSSTVKIRNKSYARLLFVVGVDYNNYKDNLDIANKLSKMVNKKYPNLSKGIVKKGGKGVDGIYNQDLTSGMVLIECGGNENNISEVMNSMNALADIIKEYLS